jgi:hypothetical protein
MGWHSIRSTTFPAGTSPFGVINDPSHPLSEENIGLFEFYERLFLLFRAFFCAETQIGLSNLFNIKEIKLNLANHFCTHSTIKSRIFEAILDEVNGSFTLELDWVSSNTKRGLIWVGLGIAGR